MSATQPEPTICAIATAAAPGAIGIVRLSGCDAIAIAQQVFVPKYPSAATAWQPYSMCYGHVFCAPNERLDEAICLVYHAPHSYTAEDVVEFCCHGGVLILQTLVQVLVRHGARLAQPGEFTRRAFANGRISLPKAEAILQLLNAQTHAALQLSNTHMQGALRQQLQALQAPLVALLAQITAELDYPEEELAPLDLADGLQTLQTAQTALARLLQQSQAAQLAQNGILTVLFGRPNAGKSSLLNAMLGYERAIVTPEPGTTRDCLCETVPFAGHLLRLQDTAGVRAATNAIEQAGIARSHEALQQADLVLLVCDASQPFCREDEQLLARLDPTKTLVLRNKIDCPPLWDPPAGYSSVAVSAKTGEGFDALAQAISALLGTVPLAPADAALTTARQCACAEQALAALCDAEKNLQAGSPIDMVSWCVEQALQHLLELSGENANEAVLQAVFSQFCLGK